MTTIGSRLLAFERATARLLMLAVLLLAATVAGCRSAPGIAVAESTIKDGVTLRLRDTGMRLDRSLCSRDSFVCAGVDDIGDVYVLTEIAHNRGARIIRLRKGVGVSVIATHPAIDPAPERWWQWTHYCFCGTGGGVGNWVRIRPDGTVANEYIPVSPYLGEGPSEQEQAGVYLGSGRWAVLTGFTRTEDATTGKLFIGRDGVVEKQLEVVGGVSGMSYSPSFGEVWLVESGNGNILAFLPGGSIISVDTTTWATSSVKWAPTELPTRAIVWEEVLPSPSKQKVVASTGCDTVLLRDGRKEGQRMRHMRPGSTFSVAWVSEQTLLYRDTEASAFYRFQHVLRAYNLSSGQACALCIPVSEGEDIGGMLLVAGAGRAYVIEFGGRVFEVEVIE